MLKITTQAELDAAMKADPNAKLEITGKAKLEVSVAGTASPLFVMGGTVGLYVVAPVWEVDEDGKPLTGL